MASLTNQYVSQSYQGLLKFENSTGATNNLQRLEDGLGNDLPIEMSLSEIQLYGLQDTSITGSLNASGLNYPTVDNGVGSFIQTDGAGNLSLQYVKTMYEEVKSREAVLIPKGSALYVSGNTGNRADVYLADSTNPNRRPATLIAGENIQPNANGIGIISGLIEGVNVGSLAAGTEVYLGTNGGWTATRPTGSASVQILGVVSRTGTNGAGYVINQLQAELPNLQSGYTWVGNASGVPQQVVYGGGGSGSSGTSGTSGSSGVAGSSGTSGTSGNSGSSGTSGNSGSSGTSGTSGVAGSSGTSGTSGQAGSSGTSGTSGVAGSSGTSGTSGTSSIVDTSSFATTGSNNFIGNQNITGDLNVTGNTLLNGNVDVTTGNLNVYSPQTRFSGSTVVITGSLNVSGSVSEITPLQIAFSNKPYYGDANTLLSLVADNSGALDFYADSDNFDTFNVLVTKNDGTTFRDWNGSSLQNWLKVPTNTGANPSPQLLRGLGITGSLNMSSGSDVNFDDYGVIVGGDVNGTGSLELIPTSSQLSSDKIVIYNDYTGLQNTQYGITIVNTGLTYANGVSASLSVTSSNNASSTLNWWYAAGSGFGVITPENGTVSLDGNGEGSFNFVIDNDTMPFNIYVSSETEFTNPYANQNGAVSLEINGSLYQSIYNVNVGTGDLQQTSIVLGNTEHGVRTNTDGGVTLTSYDYLNNQNFTLNLKNNVLTLNGSEFVNDEDFFIKTGDDLHLDALGDDVILRSAGQTRIRVGYDFVNDAAQSNFTFNPGVSTDDGYLAFPDSTNQYTAFNETAVTNLGFATTGSNTFNGDQTVNGFVSLNFGAPDTNTQKNIMTVTGSVIDGKQYNFVNVSMQDYPSFGDGYKDAFVTEYFDSTAYNFGTEFSQNGKRISAGLYASGSGRVATYSLRDQYDGTTFFNAYADEMQIGEFVAGTNTRIGIGHYALPDIEIKALDVSISGSLGITGSTIVTGSVQGNVSALSISSQTASLNLNNGNFFTLQLVSGSATHINPSNIKPGQTVNIELSTTGSGTVSFPSSVKQISGSAYIPTTTTGKDIITLVSFDTSSLYLASVKNLV